MSSLISKNLQVGSDPTATNNFTIFQPATPDGTLRIGNGNTGITSSLLTLNSSGNLGLGVTPSAWGSAFKVVDVTATASFLGSGTSAFVANNTYQDGGNWRYKTSTAAIGAQLFGLNPNGGGGYAFFQAPSGTAGNAISFTQAMTLDASGNLLVGATSGSKRLTISGSQVDVEYRDTTSGTTWNVGPVGSGSPAGRFNWYTATGAADRMFLTTAGALFNSTGTYGTISDVSLKENIVDATPKLADVMRIRVRNYNMKADPEKQKVIGVIAQELEQVFPGLVEEVGNRVALEDGSFEETIVKAVKYSVLTTILVKAIQELKAEFDAYKATHP